MWLATVDVTLLGNPLTGKRVMRVDEGTIRTAQSVIRAGREL